MARLESQICPNCGSKEVNEELRCEHCDSQLRWGDTEKTILRIAGLSNACMLAPNANLKIPLRIDSAPNAELRWSSSVRFAI